MQAMIADEANEIWVRLETADDEQYAPDVMDDICNRVVRLFEQALTSRAGVTLGIQSVVDENEGKGE